MSNLTTTPMQTDADNKAKPTSNPNQTTNQKMNLKKNEPGINSDLRNFTGETSELEAVLTLISEKCDKGVMFDVFQKKLKNYILKNFDKSEDVATLETELTDPNIEFKAAHCPADLNDVEATNAMQVQKWEYKYKKIRG